jgi:hypothetical protein
MTAALALARPLEGPFDTPPASELRPSAATLSLVRTQVKALLAATPAYHSLPPDEQSSISTDLVKISAYAAECMRDICWQSRRLNQTPVVLQREGVSGPLARAEAAAPAPAWSPPAAGNVGRITQETLRAVAFPTFVADLIRGTFTAITDSNIRQMEAFGALLRNVSGTVDDFMNANISDAQAKDWLAQQYPDHMQVQNGQLVPRQSDRELPAPNLRRDLHLEGDVDIDESSIEETLLPAARRRLAETRLQMLSTLVMMGVNRIVVTGGKIRATMGFHIDTADRMHEEHASDLDVRVQAAGSFGFGPWRAEASTSVAYVSSTRSGSDSEINVETDLTGEVEIHFKSDYFPLARFADAGMIGRIQGNTAVPDANAPAAETAPFAAAPETGGTVARFTSPQTHRAPRPQPAARPIGAPLPEERLPVAPRHPNVPQQPAQQPAPAAQPSTQPSGEVAAADGEPQSLAASMRRFR